MASVCNGVESSTRTQVVYTVGDSTPLSIQNTPSRPQYCSSDNLVLTALNGITSSYEWRLNDPNSAILGTGTTYNPTTSGTYYLTGTIACGNEQTVDIEIVFTNLAAPSLPSVTENCGTTIIARGTPPSGEVWHWQTTSDGTDQSAASTQQTRSFTASEPLFLRSRARVHRLLGSRC